MTYPWESQTPNASFEFGLADHVGSLAFFVVGGLETDVSTSFGDRDAVRCSLVLIDGPEAGKEFEDILLFNSRIVSRLRNVAGTIRLHRITYAEAKGGNNKPVEIVDATDADNELARSWYTYYPNRLQQMLAAVTASWQRNQQKVAQGQRVQSQPHPTHAGSLRPSNGWNTQAQPPPQQPAPPPNWGQQPPQQPGWGQQPPAPPAPPQQPAPPPNWGQQPPAPPQQAWSPTTATTTAAVATPWQASLAPGAVAAPREETGF